MKKLAAQLVTLVILFLVASCGDRAYYERNESITNRSWSYSDVPKFDVHIVDASVRYTIWATVRHTNAYGYANLFFLVHEKGPAQKDTVNRYEIKLAELDGRWTGNSAGNLYANKLLLKDNYQFPDTGTYSFSIEQNMRENPLREVSDVGLTVVKKP